MSLAYSFRVLPYTIFLAGDNDNDYERDTFIQVPRPVSGICVFHKKFDMLLHSFNYFSFHFILFYMNHICSLKEVAVAVRCVCACS